MSMSVSAWNVPVMIVGTVAAQVCVVPSSSVKVPACGGGDGAIETHFSSTTSKPAATLHAVASAEGEQCLQLLYFLTSRVRRWVNRKSPSAQQMPSMKQWEVPMVGPALHSVWLVDGSHTWHALPKASAVSPAA
eukprot:scaffold52556_cov55-Phaeocystis_antarctica.AAC.2